ncbi:hypothetical protein [Streptomyces himalayensis]|uniref:hypothetical protein n=1 Tax=Streptomyces himalayensis TaxID=2820085 RepID=UPI001C697274|nr:hypothetical protein [Streptomyces himalayensis]
MRDDQRGPQLVDVDRRMGTPRRSALRDGWLSTCEGSALPRVGGTEFTTPREHRITFAAGQVPTGVVVVQGTDTH